MVLWGIDCLLIWGDSNSWGWGTANIRYITHLGTPGLVIFSLDEDPVLFSNHPHTVQGWRSATHWISDIRANPRPEEVVKLLKEKGLDKGVIGTVGSGGVYRMRSVPDTVHHFYHTTILSMLPETKFLAANPILEEVRLIKSDEELRFLEKAGEQSYRMYEALVNEAKPGKTEQDLVAAMSDAMIRNGGEPNVFVLLDSGNPPIQSLGGREAPPSMRKLQEGDAICGEWHGQYAGYLHAAEHSVSLGEPRPEYRKIEKVSKEVFEAMVDIARPGSTMQQMMDALRKPVKKANLTYSELGIHGHGLASGEIPSLVYEAGSSNWIYSEVWDPSRVAAFSKVYPFEFSENMVFGTNIDISDPSWDKRAGLCFGDTLVVTKNGGRKLSKIPLELSVV
jgi:Xaa-Pro aminopeptidase